MSRRNVVVSVLGVAASLALASAVCIQRAFALGDAAAHGGDDARKQVENLVSQLRSPKPAERATAANRLGNLGAREAGLEVARLLEDGDPQVRHFAIGALLQLGVASTAGDVARFLGDPSKDTRLLAADAVLAFEHAAALPRLHEMLARESVETATLLAQRIMLAGASGAAPGLEAILAAPEPRRRMAAALALGNLEHRGAAAKIAALLEDPDADVRSSARLALGLLDPPGHAAELRGLLKSDDARDAACQVLARAQDPLAWDALWNGGEPRPGFFDLANYFTAPQTCRKLRAARFGIHELWRLELVRALELMSSRAGVEIVAAPSSAELVRKARFNPNLGMIGPRPESLSVLSILSGYFLEGIEPGERRTWIAGGGTVRIVTLEEAQAHWGELDRRQRAKK